MVVMRTRGVSSTRNISAKEEVIVVGDSELDIATAEHHQSAKIRLRQRWELASVLNFLHVFEPIIQSDLKVTAEEIETALISVNDTLARIHIAILKGIPPASKNLKENDSWVTSVCKKLAPWWPWVADGENPLKCDHGEERKKYKKLNPISRLLMLKALCEVRTEQDDILRHITDELKAGAKLTTFRKERIGGDDNGITYWYDGDPNIGHRLYKEVVKFDMKPRSRGKCCPRPSEIHSEWETLATSLEEFREISKKMSSSMSKAEALTGEIIRTDLLPVLEENQKKKERALKRKQRHAALSDNFPSRVRTTRTCRQRNPVRYTFDEFDRSISEAITQMSMKSHTKERNGDSGKQSEVLANHKSKIKDDDNGSTDDKSEDDDCDAGHDDVNSSEGSHSVGSLDHSAEQENSIQKQKQADLVQYEKDDNQKLVLGLKRSLRNVINTNQETRIHAGMKKRLRQRPTHNPGYRDAVVLDSEEVMSEFKNESGNVASSTEPSASSDGSYVNFGGV